MAMYGPCRIENGAVIRTEADRNQFFLIYQSNELPLARFGYVQIFFTDSCRSTSLDLEDRTDLQIQAKIICVKISTM